MNDLFNFLIHENSLEQTICMNRRELAQWVLQL